MNKLSVMNRLGCWIQSCITKLLHLILKKFIKKTHLYLFPTCEKASPSSIKICVMTSLSIWPVFSGSRVRKAARRSSWAAGRNFCWRMILSGQWNRKLVNIYFWSSDHNMETQLTKIVACLVNIHKMTTTKYGSPPWHNRKKPVQVDVPHLFGVLHLTYHLLQLALTRAVAQGPDDGSNLGKIN